MQNHPDDLSQRKQDHLTACLDAEVECNDHVWDLWQLRPECFPEMALAEVKLETEFLGHSLAMPFLIGAMTGGAGVGWNQELAKAAQQQKVALCLGSMRAAVLSPERAADFDVRVHAPTVPILGNIGIWELRQAGFRSSLKQLLLQLGVNGVFVHINPAQELVQRNGERDFRGALDALSEWVEESPVPVLIKEVGMGLATSHLSPLLTMGLAGVDVAGKGGTHFVRVEATRADPDSVEAVRAEALHSWGSTTVESLAEWSHLLRTTQLPVRTPALIASGGIRTAEQMALAFALGADLVSASRPLWVALREGGAEAVSAWIGRRAEQLRTLCLLCGARSPNALRGAARPRLAQRSPTSC